jgi:hypothetical protein
MSFISCIWCGKNSKVISRKTITNHTLATTLQCEAGHIWDDYSGLSPIDGVFDAKDGDGISDEVDGDFTD